jgi:hypothetical protein
MREGAISTYFEKAYDIIREAKNGGDKIRKEASRKFGDTWCKLQLIFFINLLKKITTTLSPPNFFINKKKITHTPSAFFFIQKREKAGG